MITLFFQGEYKMDDNYNYLCSDCCHSSCIDETKIECSVNNETIFLCVNRANICEYYQEKETKTHD